MTRYLVTDEQLRHAIHSAIKSLDIRPMDDNYVIDSTIKVADNVLERLAVSKIAELPASKIAEAKPTEDSKQDAGREIDTSEYPFIRLESNELVDMICDAYRNGLAD